jgi:hypothetical protein
MTLVKLATLATTFFIALVLPAQTKPSDQTKNQIQVVQSQLQTTYIKLRDLTEFQQFVQLQQQLAQLNQQLQDQIKVEQSKPTEQPKTQTKAPK